MHSTENLVFELNETNRYNIKKKKTNFPRIIKALNIDTLDKKLITKAFGINRSKWTSCEKFESPKPKQMTSGWLRQQRLS
jgi:hypothetical protein